MKALTILLAGLFLAMPVWATDLTSVEFESADPRLADGYNVAVDQLMDELMVVGKGVDGSELFRIIPYPLELVALQLQAEIHSRNVTDEIEIETMVSQANMDKPGSNWFAFLVDGESEWVNSDIAMYYIWREGGDPEPVDITAVHNFDNGDGTGYALYVLYVEDRGKMIDFMTAYSMGITLTREIPATAETQAGVEKIDLDCSHWREFTIFDIDYEE
ncbi:MAG TPA: hypothetical protein VGB30_07530 [bacterium]|jgi:hypothetical protein